jgi:hypothetical protein
MDTAIFYVSRQRNGWSVERDRMVKSAHADREVAIVRAREAAAAAMARGEVSCVRIQEDAGVWREDRSFAPRS